VIHTLFIANRGEIALRVAHTAKRMGIRVAVAYSEADAKALFVEQADVALPLRGNSAADTYLRGDVLIAAAKQCGANALHPGYGFLSENAAFAQAVIQAGLIWIGPSPAAIRAVGSKAAAKDLARSLKIPTLPGYYGKEQAIEHLMAQADTLGPPLMIKACAGGGGRGMRLLRELGSHQQELLSAQREAQAAFGDPQLLLERALLNPRHIEIQVFADAHGGCVHLGERDCSVQRRHQKIVEESPSPALKPEQRTQLGAAAVAFARAANYLGAGTIEFLWDDQQQQAYLMEMNTRLQVEHPVTEARVRIDLVEWQLRIANGEALPLEQTEIDARLAQSGHAIEVRLCAENAAFVPQTGHIREVHWPTPASQFEPSALRIDSGVRGGDIVSPYYDSMLAKLIAYAPTRDVARNQLERALSATRIVGIDTNRAILAAILLDPVFASGQALVPFLNENAATLGAQLSASHASHASAFAQACALLNVQMRPSLVAPFPRPLRFRYQSGGQEHRVNLSVAADVTHTSHVACAQIAPGRYHVHADGIDLQLDDISFEPTIAPLSASAPWSVAAPFNGKVVRIAATVGQTVNKGDTLLVIESMKLEHAILATQAGIVSAILTTQDQQVSPMQLLLNADPLPSLAPVSP
jgi:geranyl-CoA carboxylase alpha subunit